MKKRAEELETQYQVNCVSMFAQASSKSHVMLGYGVQVNFGFD